ncbi:MAG: nitrile hydratase subunit beta, partial [Acidimicrobiaceae bacterium]|nr:nitrile hydratase subunit beta [Acidimicrobiaceae bacterium]MYH94383.1 nitrile hydratase subunit beta [Acidimicrobiaceae bacterium]
MDGIHDMGGMHGWGTVAIDPDEPVFRESWHGRAFAMGAMSMGLSGTNLDAFRHGLERLHPYDYLADGYYGRWLACAETLLVDS